MTYASYEDFRNEFGDDDLPDDAETRVVRAIDRASRLADNENIRKRYEDALGFLEGVATGKIHLIAEGKTTTGSKLTNIRLFRA